MDDHASAAMAARLANQNCVSAESNPHVPQPSPLPTTCIRHDGATFMQTYAPKAPHARSGLLPLNFCDLRDTSDAAVGAMIVGSYGDHPLNFTRSYSTSAFLDLNQPTRPGEKIAADADHTPNPEDALATHAEAYHALKLDLYAGIDQAYLQLHRAHHGVDSKMSESVIITIHFSEQISNKLKMITKLHMIDAASHGHPGPPCILVPETEYQLMYGKLEHFLRAYGTAVSHIPRELFRPPEIREAIVTAYNDPHLMCMHIRQTIEATIAQAMAQREATIGEQPKQANASPHAWPAGGYTLPTPPSSLDSGKPVR